MTDRSDNSPAKLLAACKKGDRKAWNELIELITPVVFAICSRARVSRDESFDIFGQICLELIDSIGEIKSPEKITSYVSTITKRKIYRIYRRMQILDRISSEVRGYLHGSTSDDPELRYEDIERRMIVRNALRELKPRDRRLIEALFLDPSRPSYKEISKSLRIPVPSIGPTRMRALEELQRILKRKGFEE